MFLLSASSPFDPRPKWANMNGMKHAAILHNTIQHYPWGSTELMPELLERENPEGEPFAEMWMGVHPRGPSQVLSTEGRRPLAELVEKNADSFLGSAISDRYGAKLPFLFKVLAAGEPLSIQAHPDKKRAEEGFAREENAGIPIDAFERNYRDDNHKPEIICALTPFTAMCGFRTVEELRKGLSGVESDLIRQKLLPPLDADEGEDKRLKNFFTLLMRMDETETENLVRDLVRWAEGRQTIEASLVRRFHELHGIDRGIAAPLYLNILTLKEGEALFQPAGVLHAYVEGMGVELMANSDNVLRGGLTKKHVDVDELLSILSFAPRPPDVLAPSSVAEGIEEYPAPIEEFLLRRLTAYREKPLRVNMRSSIEIGICVKGSCRLVPEAAPGADGGAAGRPEEESFPSLELKRGESFIVPLAAGDYRIEGKARIYLATIPRCS